MPALLEKWRSRAGDSLPYLAGGGGWEAGVRGIRRKRKRSMSADFCHLPYWTKEEGKTGAIDMGLGIYMNWFKVNWVQLGLSLLNIQNTVESNVAFEESVHLLKVNYHCLGMSDYFLGFLPIWQSFVGNVVQKKTKGNVRKNVTCYSSIGLVDLTTKSA